MLELAATVERTILSICFESKSRSRNLVKPDFIALISTRSTWLRSKKKKSSQPQITQRSKYRPLN